MDEELSLAGVPQDKRGACIAKIIEQMEGGLRGTYKESEYSYKIARLAAPYAGDEAKSSPGKIDYRQISYVYKGLAWGLAVDLFALDAKAEKVQLKAIAESRLTIFLFLTGFFVGGLAGLALPFLYLEEGIRIRGSAVFFSGLIGGGCGLVVGGVGWVLARPVFRSRSLLNDELGQIYTNMRTICNDVIAEFSS